MRRFRWIAAFVVAAGTMAGLAGCGEGDSGASKRPTITAKPAEDKSSPANGKKSTEQPAAGGFGTLAGTITLDGEPPSLNPLVAQGQKVKDGEVCAAEPVPNQALVVDAETKGIANVFVFLDRVPSGVEVPPAKEEPLIFDQKGCTFLPHTVLVRTGRPFKVVSSDPIAHNTNFSTDFNGKENFLLAPNDKGGAPVVFKFSEKQPFQIKCDIHPWMSAYGMVLDHPYMALTDAKGSFEIPDFPAGEFRIKVWHESAGFLELGVPVTIEDGKTATMEKSYGPDRFQVARIPGLKTISISAR